MHCSSTHNQQQQKKKEKKRSWCVINPFGGGTSKRGEGSFWVCRCAQNGINVTLETRVSLPWWITEGLTIMEIVIDWSFVSIYCSSVPLWPSTLKCYHVNSSTGCYQCSLCSHNGRALQVCCKTSIVIRSSTVEPSDRWRGERGSLIKNWLVLVIEWEKMQIKQAKKELNLRTSYSHWCQMWS